MNFPTNVKYTKEHEWIRLEGDVAYVGITDYAQEQLGDIVFVDIPTEGETLAADEVFGTIEVVKTISDLFLPVTGEILEQNEALADQPELVNQDPYGEGWLIKIKPAADADFDSLLDAEAYKALKATSPPITAPAPAMCSLSFHFKLTMTQIIITTRAESMIPVIYHGILSRCIMSRQNT